MTCELRVPVGWTEREDHNLRNAASQQNEQRLSKGTGSYQVWNEVGGCSFSDAEPTCRSMLEEMVPLSRSVSLDHSAWIDLDNVQLIDAVGRHGRKWHVILERRARQALEGGSTPSHPTDLPDQPTQSRVSYCSGTGTPNTPGVFNLPSTPDPELAVQAWTVDGSRDVVMGNEYLVTTPDTLIIDEGHRHHPSPGNPIQPPWTGWSLVFGAMGTEYPRTSSTMFLEQLESEVINRLISVLVESNASAKMRLF
ncbi:uncharacterized protein A1O9_03907 [Exophiala aquamarina CBS 119918]|uniref:Uncharacterized protein n=1 Tax=Exophiala aquamarina CBS 119918 TaxID=1182545 RepID=A0A072PFZ9_9EURO|nr:uncharacterized protein A1O9_03907 [Exophiala aquamarina CBS 119918]KEF59064.1 hypothetical protein A1O9_03907 [Exophiala aquamarina CBS 119918]